MNCYFLEYFDIFMIQKDFDLDWIAFVVFVLTVNALFDFMGGKNIFYFGMVF